MAKIKTSSLVGPALDWAVIKANGWEADYMRFGFSLGDGDSTYNPLTDWSQGGPIIEREGITIQYWKTGTSGYWSAFASITSNSDYPIPSYEGETMLIAAMRCYVASKLGDEVDIPEELIGDESLWANT